MKFILASLTLVAAAFALPSTVSAQTASSSLLNVYVQVLNQGGYQTYVPSNFTVSVSGTSPSPSTFSGSQSGTLVSLQPGSYSVTITNTSGFNPTYSTGCNGTAAANNTQTCVVTISTNSYQYPSGVQPYPYYYQQQPLSCRTETPRVGLGQTARFVAVGGVGGTYNWTTGSQTFANIGQTLTATFNSSGTHAVTVTNASQSATCTVEVTTTYYPVQTNPGYYPTTPGYPYTTAPVLTSVVYPRFPNTGLEPIEAVQLAFAAVFLIAAAAALYPYGRKVLATL